MEVVPAPLSPLQLEECLLCLESTPCQTTDSSSVLWDSVWADNCAESLCKMLDLSVDMFRAFFLGLYCPTCKQMMRDVDYLIRTIDTLEKNLSSHRVKVSTLLHDNFETWIHKRNVPSPLSDPHRTNVPSTKLSSHAPCQRHPVVAQPTPAPSSFGYDFQPDEIKQDEDAQPFPSLLSSHDETAHAFVTDLDFAHLTGHLNLEEDHEVPVSKRVKTTEPLSSGVSQNFPQLGTRFGRVTRASNRLRKENTYREDSDSDSEDLQSTNNACPDVDSCEDEHWKTGQRSSSVTSNSIGIGIVTLSRKKRNLDSNCTSDPTFEIFSDMEESEGDASAGGQSEVDASENVEESPVRTRRRRSRVRPEVTLAREEMVALQATKKFLYELDRDEIEKKYSYICTSEDCGRRFRGYEDLQKHKMNEHSEAFFARTFQCPFCPDVWAVHDYQLDAHIIRFHQGETKCFICPVMECPAKYSENLKLVGHLRREHPYYPIEESRSAPFSFPLDYRDKKAMVPGNAQCPGRRKKTLKMLRCPVPGCPARCSTQLVLDMHQSKVHDKDPLPFKCREEGCRKAFKTYQQGYTRHMKLVHGAMGMKANLVTCLFCSFRCMAPFNLNLHMRRKHAKDDVPKFNCKVCGYLYFVSGECEDHEKLHTEVTGFDCVIRLCHSKGFVSQEALKTHTLESHVRPQGKVCDICGSVHGSNFLLTRHRRTHTGEEPFKCRHCDKRFKSDNNRKSHEQIMHGNKMEKKTYKCKQCDETFTVQQYLYKHNAWHKYGANANLPVAKKKPVQQDCSG